MLRLAGDAQHWLAIQSNAPPGSKKGTSSSLSDCANEQSALGVIRRQLWNGGDSSTQHHRDSEDEDDDGGGGGGRDQPAAARPARVGREHLLIYARYDWTDLEDVMAGRERGSISTAREHGAVALVST
jgi:hypothetical protein